MSSRLLKAIAAMFHNGKDHDNARHRSKLLSEYKGRRPLYEEFCMVIYKLLVSFLKEGRCRHQVSYRTKDPDKLYEKLVRKSAEGKYYEKLSDIEDLAGLRVIFYYESDKERFMKEFKKEVSGVIKVEDRKRTGGYEATHVIMELGPKRLQLSEYRRFEGMKCEIQITTVLRHAWAEIEHDFIYKDIDHLKDNDPERFAVIQAKLKEILEKYIKEASREFEQILPKKDRGKIIPRPRVIF